MHESTAPKMAQVMPNIKLTHPGSHGPGSLASLSLRCVGPVPHVALPAALLRASVPESVEELDANGGEDDAGTVEPALLCASGMPVTAVPLGPAATTLTGSMFNVSWISLSSDTFKLRR